MDSAGGRLEQYVSTAIGSASSGTTSDPMLWRTIALESSRSASGWSGIAVR